MYLPLFFESIKKPLGRDARLFNFNDPMWDVLQDLYNGYSNRSNEHKSHIPKIIHQIWFGGDLPSDSIELQKRIIEFNPGYTYKLWTDDDLGFFGDEFADKLSKISNLGLKSDIFRYLILEFHGGIYLDCDFYCTNNFDVLIRGNEFFAGIGNPDIKSLPSILNSCFGCSVNNAIMKSISTELINNIESFYLLQKAEDIFNATGPTFFTEIILTYLKYEPNKNIVIFPSTFLYPINNRRRYFINQKMLNENTYAETVAIHLWNVSWIKSNDILFDKFQAYVPLRVLLLLKKIGLLHLVRIIRFVCKRLNVSIKL